MKTLFLWTMDDGKYLFHMQRWLDLPYLIPVGTTISTEPYDGAIVESVNFNIDKREVWVWLSDREFTEHGVAEIAANQLMEYGWEIESTDEYENDPSAEAVTPSPPAV